MCDSFLKCHSKHPIYFHSYIAIAVDNVHFSHTNE